VSRLESAVDAIVNVLNGLQPIEQVQIAQWVNASVLAAGNPPSALWYSNAVLEEAIEETCKAYVELGCDMSRLREQARREVGV
jgi:hypothetical protein